MATLDAGGQTLTLADLFGQTTRTLADYGGGIVVTPPPPADITCVTVVLNLGSSGPLTFDYATPDQFSNQGTLWFWGDLTGWWDPPKPIRSSLVGPSANGKAIAAKVTAARWAPRDINLIIYAGLNGSAQAHVDALNTVAAFATPFNPPPTSAPGTGTLTVNDTAPKTITVRLGGRCQTELIGNKLLLKVTVPLVAHDPLRRLVSSGARVL